MTQLFFIILGPLFLISALFFPHPESLNHSAWLAGGITLWMAIWWITEVVPIPVTALIPMVFFPVFNIVEPKEISSSYSDPVLYLFLGGFIVAFGMEKSNLHKRIALNVIRWIGISPSRLVLGFSISAAFISMWISNTATTLMMLPIALATIDTVQKSDEFIEEDLLNNFKKSLMLAIAYSSSIGGMGTLIGTPPNAFMSAYLVKKNIELGFAKWMIIGVPIVIIYIPIMYFVLVRICYPLKGKKLNKEKILEQIMSMPKASLQEKLVGIIFAIMCILFTIRPIIQESIKGFSDTTIALVCGLSMFLIPTDFKNKKFLVDWKTAQNLPWDVLILMGGGLCLSIGLEKTGLAMWIGKLSLPLQSLPLVVLITIVTGTIVFLTEITSNTAIAATFIPVVASIAEGMGVSIITLVIPITIGASCAFMLPVATPPNAIIYGSGHLKMKDMVVPGLILNIIFTLTLPPLVYWMIQFL